MVAALAAYRCGLGAMMQTISTLMAISIAYQSPAAANAAPIAGANLIAPPSAAQVAPVSASVASQQPIVPMQAPSNVTYLPAGYDIIVTPLDGITSKGHEVGSTFSIKTVYDVQYNGYTIIPHGTLGQARITWRTGKGMFGKSAKIDLAFDWLDLNGRRISLGGTYRQNGQGNSGATVGTTVGLIVLTGGLGLASGFITGKSAMIQPGTQMTAHTMEALPIALPANAPVNAIQAVAPVQPAPVSVAPAQATVAPPTSPSLTPTALTSKP